jgi:hypothetical protein
MKTTTRERDIAKLKTLCDRLYDAKTPERVRRDLSMRVSILRARLSKTRDPLAAMISASGDSDETEN